MNADRWGQLTDSVRDFLDSGIRRILGGVTVDPITGYEYIFSQIREIFFSQMSNFMRYLRSELCGNEKGR